MTIPGFLGRPGLGAAGVLVAALLAALAAYVALRLVVRHVRSQRDVLAIVLRRGMTRTSTPCNC